MAIRPHSQGQDSTVSSAFSGLGAKGGETLSIPLPGEAGCSRRCRGIITGSGRQTAQGARPHGARVPAGVEGLSGQPWAGGSG